MGQRLSLGSVPRTLFAVATMTAIVHDAYGTVPEDVLRLEEVDKPTIADGQVLVRVHAASVDRGTWHIMAGLPYPIRVAGFGLRKPKYLNPGRSLAGTVEAVGQKVTGFEPGDEVFGICDGSFAEYVGVRTDKLAPKPSNVSFDEAAAVPISGLTALQAVRDQGRVEAGQAVLIVGASGGVGSFAVQIAKAFGGVVTGVCSTAKADLVRALGADHVIDYNREDSPTASTATTSSSTSAATAGCPTSGAPSPPREHSSSSEARPRVGGWAAPTDNSGRSCCPSSSARNWAPSSHRRTPPT
jgi:NADPH:quinone reductase-like Zn-dependent oxidoreductase